MQLVERHIFSYSQHLDNLCWLSKCLYNHCLYEIRQHWFKTGLMLSEYELSTRLAKEDNPFYRAFPAQTSQQIIKLLFKNFKSFFKAIKEWKKNPSKFKSRPKIPGYKDKQDGQNIVIFTNQNCGLKNGFINFPKLVKLNPLKTKVDNLHQVRIIPQCGCYIIEIVYEKKEVNYELDSSKYCGIDLGVSNIITMIDNSGFVPIIVKGGVLKRVNQWWNKRKAELQSYLKNNRKTSERIEHLTLRRNCKIDDLLHKISRYVIDHCIKHEIKTIVIGYNEEWKQEVNLGNKTNQNFVYLPHKKLIDKIKYKAQLVGIDVKIHEESYTSKCDALAFEEVKKHEEYIGRRVNRGLFKSSVGKVLNADVNGALNILRKVVDESVVRQIIDVSRVFRPVKVLIT